MNHITITIATRNRFDKLLKCLASIPRGDNVSVIVCCDADTETFSTLDPTLVDLILLSESHIGSPHCHNIMAKHAKDGLLYLMDDMELYPDTIGHALADYNAHFPDDDGMMGIAQDLVDGGESGVALLGREFLARFPLNRFSYPGYWHFSDMETMALAKKIVRFYFSEKARVKHYHPDSGLEDKDQTHFDARLRKQEDFQLFKTRQQAGQIYGLSE